MSSSYCLMCDTPGRPLTRRDYWAGRYCNAHGLQVRAAVKKRIEHPYYFRQDVKEFIAKFPRAIEYLDPEVFGLHGVPVSMPARPRCGRRPKLAPRKRNLKAWCASCHELLGKYSRRGTDCHLCSKCGLREQRQLRKDADGLKLVRAFEYLCPDVASNFLRADILNWISFYR